MDFANKVALVTGASGGMGAAIARLLLPVLTEAQVARAVVAGVAGVARI